MSDRAPAAIQPGSSAYRAPGVALWRAVFRPLRPDLESVGRYAAILAGALAGGLLFRWHTPVGYVVLLLALALAVLPPLLGRGLWGWQAVLISSGLRSRTQIKAIVGEVNDKAAAEWLAASSGASASDRYHVLAFLGRDEEAERLIPEAADLDSR